MPEFADWTRAAAMMGTDGTDYIPVLLGSDGSMYAVLQGEYEGALKTIKLDDEGRISAFVIDSTDAWGRMLSIGNAELAARLGSPIRYDKRGEVRDFVTFEDGTGGVWFEGDALGSAHALDVSRALYSGYSVRVDLAASANAWYNIRLNAPSDPSVVVGIEAAFSMDTVDVEIEVGIYRFTSTQEVLMFVRYDPDAETLRLVDFDSGTPTFATGVKIYTSDPTFSRLKVVADLGGGTYYRCQLNDTEWDLSAYSPWPSTNATVKHIRAYVKLRNNVAAARSVYIDNLIYTVAEPAN